MNTGWNITFDPLSLSSAPDDLVGLEEQAKEQGEDIIQAEAVNGKNRIIDLGWYGDRYKVFFLEDADWSNPLREFESQNLKDALDIFRRLQT